MKLYYSAPGVSLYHGDSEEMLTAPPRFDLLVTDPPYGIKYQSKRGVAPSRPIVGDSKFPGEALLGWVKKANCAAYIFFDIRRINELPHPPRNVLAWVKNNHSSGDLRHSHGRRWEACAFYPGPHHKFLSRPTDVIDVRRVPDAQHPTEKSVNGLAAIIAPNVGSVVFDPYCGAGSSLVAARREGREAVGCEIEEVYCEKAAKRLDQNQTEMFVSPGSF